MWTDHNLLIYLPVNGMWTYVPVFGLWWTMLLWMYKSLWKHIFPFLLDIYLGVKLLGHPEMPKVSKVSAPDSQRMRVPATPLPCQQLTRCIFFIFLISSWNKDCQEEHQQTQICRWYHSKAEREEELKRLLMRVKEGWGIVAQLCLTLCDPSDYIGQAPLSMVFSRQEYWNRLPCPFPGKGKRGEWKSWLKAQHSKN